MRKHIFLGSLFFCFFGYSQAQIDSSYSLQQCIDYAFLNVHSIKNATIDTKLSTASGNETKSGALPQINGNVQLTDNIIIPTSFIPAQFFQGPPGELSTLR